MCRDGDCGTCIANCPSGTVKMEGNNLLEEEDVANGDVRDLSAHVCRGRAGQGLCTEAARMNRE